MDLVRFCHLLQHEVINPGVKVIFYELLIYCPTVISLSLIPVRFSSIVAWPLETYHLNTNNKTQTITTNYNIVLLYAIRYNISVYNRAFVRFNETIILNSV